MEILCPSPVSLQNWTVKIPAAKHSVATNTVNTDLPGIILRISVDFAASTTNDLNQSINFRLLIISPFFEQFTIVKLASETLLLAVGAGRWLNDKTLARRSKGCGFDTR